MVKQDGILTLMPSPSATHMVVVRSPAGHAHAGVLVILGIVCALAQASAGVAGGWEWGAVGVLASAILVPAGFFLSVIGRDPQKPGRAMALLWTGVVVLAFSLAVVGASVIAAGVAALG